MRKAIALIISLMFLTQVVSAQFPMAGDPFELEIEDRVDDVVAEDITNSSDTSKTPVDAPHVDITGASFRTQSDNATHLNFQGEATFSAQPVVNGSTMHLWNLSIFPHSGAVVEIRLQLAVGTDSLGDTPMASVMVIYSNSDSYQYETPLQHLITGTTLTAQADLAVPSEVDAGIFLAAKHEAFFNSSHYQDNVVRSDGVHKKLYSNAEVDVPHFTKARRGTFEDDYNDVVKEDPVTYEAVPAFAPHLDIIRSIFTLHEINDTNVFLMINTTFSTAPILNGSVDYFIEFVHGGSLIPSESYVMKITEEGLKGVWVMHDGWDFHSQVMSVNMDVYHNTISVYGIFPQSKDVVFEDEKRYDLRFAVYDSLDPRVEDGLYLHDMLNHHFSFDSDGFVVSYTSEDTEAAFVPFQPLAFLALIALPILRRRIR